MTVTGVVSTAVDSSFVRVRKPNRRMFEKLHKNHSAEQSANVQTRLDVFNADTNWFVKEKSKRFYLDLLSIPQSGGNNIKKTFRWDHRSIVGSTYRPYNGSSSVVVVV